MRSRNLSRSIAGVIVTSLIGLLPSNALAQCLTTFEGELSPIDPTEVFDNWLGWSFASDGDVVAVGAPKRTSGGIPRVYIYRFDGVNWAEEQSITHSPGNFVGMDAESVALQGDVLMVSGAGGIPPGAPQPVGGVFIYRFDPLASPGEDKWKLEQTLTSEFLPGFPSFGDHIAVDGNRAAIYNGAGGVTSYEFNGASWEVDRHIWYFSNFLPSSLAMKGNRLVVGWRNLVSNPGVVVYYEHDAISWVRLQDLMIADAVMASQNNYPVDIDIDGDLIVAGAPSGTSNPDPWSRVIVFRNNGGVWGEEASLASPDTDVLNFGLQVSVANGVIGVGSWNRKPAQAFRQVGGSWVRFFENTNDVRVLIDGDRIISTNVSNGQPAHSYRIATDGNDCNANGTPDSCDIAAATSFDQNLNGIPDDCECDIDPTLDSCRIARGDSNLDGTVGIADFLAVLAKWGPCPPSCPVDADGDGFVGILDFLNVLANWG